MVIAILFSIITFVLVLATLLLVIQIGFVRLASPIGIMNDGTPVGTVAPSWTLPDLEGKEHRTPAGDHWQVLLFADISLASFPSLVAALRDTNPLTGATVLMLSHESHETCRAMQRGLQISIPIIPVQQTLFDEYRVRVVPFTFFIDAHGVVHWKGLTNAIEQWEEVWHLAQRDDTVSVEATRSRS